MQSRLPNHANLTDEEKHIALTAICERIKADLIAAGERALPAEERDFLGLEPPNPISLRIQRPAAGPKQDSPQTI